MSKIYRVSLTLCRFIGVIAGLVLLVALPITSQAQIGENLTLEWGDDGMNEINERRVLVTPSLIMVDPKTKTATIELLNKTKDTLEAEIHIGLRPPALDMFGAGTQSNDQSSTSPLLTDTPNKTTTIDSISSSKSLAHWIKDLPSKVKLAPGEKKTVTVTLNIPADLKPGEYAAWIVTTTVTKKWLMGKLEPGETEEDIKKIALEINKDAKPMIFRVEAGGKLVYRIEAAK